MKKRSKYSNKRRIKNVAEAVAYDSDNDNKRPLYCTIYPHGQKAHYIIHIKLISQYHIK